MAKNSGILKKIVNSQIYLSRWFDKVLPNKFRVSGWGDFERSFLPRYLKENTTVYDVGGGKNPFISPTRRDELAITYVGVDFDEKELEEPSASAYHRTICADITTYRGDEDGDLVICRALLEHVRDVDLALAGIASILKRGGRATIFVPCRNALFARLNMLLPEGAKRFLLSSLFPEKRHVLGFPVFYDRCTPRDLQAIGKRHGLELEERRVYFNSFYFSVFFPVYLLWRLWVLLFYLFAKEQAAETMSLAFKKTANSSRVG